MTKSQGRVLGAFIGHVLRCAAVGALVHYGYFGVAAAATVWYCARGGTLPE